MNPIQQASNYDKIAEHWNSDRFNRENGKLNRTGMFVDENVVLNKTGMSVYINFMPVLLFKSPQMYR